MASKTADAIKLVLRLPKPLHKRLKQQARRNNVSLNTEIVNQLEGHEAAALQRIKPVIKEMKESTALLGEFMQTSHDLYTSLDRLVREEARDLFTSLDRLVRAREEEAAKEAEAAIREGRPRGFFPSYGRSIGPAAEAAQKAAYAAKHHSVEAASNRAQPTFHLYGEGGGYRATTTTLVERDQEKSDKSEREQK
jgi:hypothetical protein